MVVLAVGGVGGVAEFVDLGAALGVHGERGWRDVWGVEGEEGAVEGVEVVEFGVDLVGGVCGERDGFGGWVEVQGVLVEEVDCAGHFGGFCIGGLVSFLVRSCLWSGWRLAVEVRCRHKKGFHVLCVEFQENGHMPLMILTSNLPQHKMRTKVVVVVQVSFMSSQAVQTRDRKAVAEYLLIVMNHYEYRYRALQNTPS